MPRSSHNRQLKEHFWNYVIFNLVPRPNVSFGQHQDTELWNNQFPDSKILGVPVSRRMRAMTISCQSMSISIPEPTCLLVSAWPKKAWALGTRLPCFKPRHAKPELLKSWSLEIDYSRAPCLGAVQKTRGLWERVCVIFTSLVRTCAEDMSKA